MSPARAHLGHASTYTPMDVLTRYHRMLGDNADWLPGMDHAAIATEAVLVRELAREGIRREDLGRERFVERAWEWSRTYGGAIDEQFRRLGFGPDWERSRFTMDERLSAAVNRVFVQSLPRGADLSRNATYQLGSQGADHRLGCGARIRRARRNALARPLSVRERRRGRNRDCHHASGDDARRRCDRRAPCGSRAMRTSSDETSGCRRCSSGRFRSSPTRRSTASSEPAPSR